MWSLPAIWWVVWSVQLWCCANYTPNLGKSRIQLPTFEYLPSKALQHSCSISVVQVKCTGIAKASRQSVFSTDVESVWNEVSKASSDLASIWKVTNSNSCWTLELPIDFFPIPPNLVMFHSSMFSILWTLMSCIHIRLPMWFTCTPAPSMFVRV